MRRRRFLLYGIPELKLRTWVAEGELKPEPVPGRTWFELVWVEEVGGCSCPKPLLDLDCPKHGDHQPNA
jgi:hypothetical protein